MVCRLKVTKERGEQLAVEYGIKFMETSAKASTNVEEAFFTLASDIKSKMEKRMVSNNVINATTITLFAHHTVLFLFQEVNNPPKGGHQLRASEPTRKADSWLSRCSLL